MKNIKNEKGGSAIELIIALLFVGMVFMKFMEIDPVTTWSWWWITSPLWMPPVCFISFVILIGLILAMITLVHGFFYKTKLGIAIRERVKKTWNYEWIKSIRSFCWKWTGWFFKFMWKIISVSAKAFHSKFGKMYGWLIDIIMPGEMKTKYGVKSSRKSFHTH